MKFNDIKELYHGTSSANLDSIHLHGLCPLKYDHQIQNYWDGFIVNPELVFLTTKISQAYGTAGRSTWKHGGESVILIIDPKTLNKNLLRADDNYHVVWTSNNGWQGSDCTHKNRSYMKSLKETGHVGYQGIIKQFKIKGK